MTLDADIAAIEDGNVTQAGLFLFYSILAAFGSLATLIILVIVLGFMLKKIGLGNLLKMKG